LNLRHGDATTRWQRVAAIASSFLSFSFEPALKNWLEAVSPHAIPTGLGVVVSAGKVSAIRAYVGVYDPTIGVLSSLCSGGAATAPGELVQAHDSFTDCFGSMSPQGVTIGYDFIRDTTSSAASPAIGRVKVDICCELVEQGQRSKLAPWVSQLLAAWSFQSHSLAAFLDDVHAVWTGSDIQFLSLGFAPALDHVTVYVKPRA
jgi:hypothetical protein